MSLSTPKRWPGLLLATVLSAFILLFVSVAIYENLVNPLAVLVVLIPWAIVWHVQRSESRCPACKRPAALRTRTFSEDPGLRCRFCGHVHDPESSLDVSPMTGGHPPARGLEKIIVLFVICVAAAMMLFNILAGESGPFLLVPAIMLLIGFARLYGWVAQGSGGSGGGGGGGGGGGC